MKKKRKKSKPRYNEKRENESNLNKYRVANGYLIKEICEKVGATPSEFSKLCSGISIPYYICKSKRGQIKPYVIRLSKILNVPLDELFPRYICDIERNDSKDLLPIQHEGISISNYSTNISSKQLSDIEEEQLKILKSTFKKIPDIKHREIFIKSYYNRETLGDISKDFGISRERISQIIRKIRKQVYDMIGYDMLKKLINNQEKFEEVKEETWGEIIEEAKELKLKHHKLQQENERLERVNDSLKYDFKDIDKELEKRLGHIKEMKRSIIDFCQDCPLRNHSCSVCSLYKIVKKYRLYLYLK